MLAIGNSGAISKPKTYSLFRLSMVTSIVCGLEFCASVALSYVPSMLLKAGLMEQQMTLVMGLGPFVGFFFCPIIGRLSDNCQSRFGRRKPFIFTLSLAILFSLSMIYYSQILLYHATSHETLGIIMDTTQDLFSPSHVSVGLLVFACVLLDFASQAAFNPIESLLLDMCQGTDREHSCFTVYSFMNSLGGCFGYLVTGISWKAVYSLIFSISTKDKGNEVAEAAQEDLDQERSVFSILGLLYAVFAIATLVSSNDSVRSLENEKDDEESLLTDDDSKDSFNINTYIPPDTRNNLPFLKSSLKLCNQFISRFLKIGFVANVVKMPSALRTLALADCTSWTALMCFTQLYMDYVGQIVFKGNPNSLPGSQDRILYDQGIRSASWGLFNHCVVAMIYACVINKVIIRCGLVKTFACSILSFTVCMFVILTTDSIFVVNLMASMTGIALASLTTIPYALVTLYHSNKKVTFLFF